MRKAMKPIIAAVLAIAMLLGSVTIAFAAPLPDGRDPTTPVSLTVHHMRGTLPAPLPHPGQTPPPTTGAYVVDALWSMIRVIGPADFSPWPQNSPPPTSAAGTTTVDPAVFAAIVGTINADGTMTGGVDTSGAPVAIPSAPGQYGWPVPGQAGWFVTSSRVPAPATGATGQAVFNSGDIAGSVPTVSPAPVPPDIGHGHWLVWEHSPTSITPVPERFPGFMVNLPTFLHDNNGGGTWIYSVNVFPKGPRDSQLDKQVLPGTTPRPGSVPAVGGQPAQEYLITEWRISFEVDHGIMSIIPNPTANPPVLGLPVPSVPQLGTPLLSETDTFILITDNLDDRLNLLLNSHQSAQTTGTHWDPTAQLRVYVIPDGGTATPLVQAGNWVLSRQVTGANNVETFRLGFTAAGLTQINTLRGAEDTATVRIDFATIAYNLYAIGDHDPIENVFDFNFSNQQVILWGQHDDDRPGVTPSPPPRVHPAELIVNKINLAGQPLDGAVFFLFSAAQIDSTTNRPYPTAEPYRIAISGGLAGNDAGIQARAAAVSNPALPQLHIDAINAHPEMVGRFPPALTADLSPGDALFAGLPRGAVFYLYEAVPPVGGYRRISTPQQITITALCVTEETYVPGPGGTPGTDVPHVCATHAHDCQFRYDLDFTNTQDFRLPMTGGAGTLMFTTAGVSLMGIAGLFLFLARKKGKNEEVSMQ